MFMKGVFITYVWKDSLQFIPKWSILRKCEMKNYVIHNVQSSKYKLIQTNLSFKQFGLHNIAIHVQM